MNASTQAEPASGPASLFGGYESAAATYDEMFAAPGQVRPHWQLFAQSLDALGPQEVTRRLAQGRELIAQNGVTYNVYGDAGAVVRPWELDPLPLLIQEEEWAVVAAGLRQRAHLLDRILADLYGPQELVQSGVLPPEVVFAHPGFLRPCHGIRLPNDRHLHLYAAHLARAVDGGWWVLADRTEAPAGAGYALENRVVMSQMLPGVFQRCNTRRLAPFYISVDRMLRSLAQRHGDNPRIVLLSNGPGHPSYFEDAYLSRYLGYGMVEDGDLTVRDGNVFLKTLGGLLNIDVILRRMPDSFCDPLELSTQGGRGIAGLTQAVRLGNVSVANSLGSGVLNTPALMAFYPILCKHLLGEELKLPSVATWWCGHEEARNYVLENLENLIIKPAFGDSDFKSLHGGDLSTAERETLRQRILADPRNFVGQERVNRSTAPVWSPQGPKPQHIAMRTFLVATEHGYDVMDGGLVSVSSTENALDVSVAAGETSKDLWVMARSPVPPVTLLPPGGKPVELRRTGNELPSRAADNLYWLGRLVERAECNARLMRNILARLTSESDTGGVSELSILLRALAEQSPMEGLDPAQTPAQQVAAFELEMAEMVFRSTRAGSLRSTLDALSRAASVVRDRISSDTWRSLLRIDHDFRVAQPAEALQLSDVLVLLNQLVINLAAFSGLEMESMTRNQAWRFVDIGRRLERAMQTLGLLRATLTRQEETSGALLFAILDIADSSMTYRSRYLGTLQLGPVLDLLLTDETNPRSVAFQLNALSDHVEHLPRDHSKPSRTPEQRVMLASLTSLRMAEIDPLCEADKEGFRQSLDRLLGRLLGQLPTLSECLTHRYLVHSGTAGRLTEIRPSV